MLRRQHHTVNCLFLRFGQGMVNQSPVRPPSGIGLGRIGKLTGKSIFPGGRGPPGAGILDHRWPSASAQISRNPSGPTFPCVLTEERKKWVRPPRAPPKTGEGFLSRPPFLGPPTRFPKATPVPAGEGDADSFRSNPAEKTTVGPSRERQSTPRILIPRDPEPPPHYQPARDKASRTTELGRRRTNPTSLWQLSAYPNSRRLASRKAVGILSQEEWRGDKESLLMAWGVTQDINAAPSVNGKLTFLPWRAAPVPGPP